MTPVSRWHNVEFTYHVELEVSPDGRVMTDRGELPFLRGRAPDWARYGEVVLTGVSNGHHDPGYISGPPEDCYPGSTEEERLFDSAWIHWMSDPSGAQDDDALLTDAQGQFVWDLFAADIDKIDLGDILKNHEFD